MPPKQVTPALGLDSYSCPHCGALAAQHWFRVFPKIYDSKQRPSLLGINQIVARRNRMSEKKDDVSSIQAAIDRLQTNAVTYLYDRDLPATTWEMLNMHMSLCHAC